MRKVGIVSEYFYPHLGGITEHVNYFSKELIRRGIEVVLLTGDMGGDSDIEIPEGLRIIRVGKSATIYSGDSFAKVTMGLRLKRKIKQILSEEKFDLLHIQSALQPTLPIMFQKYSDTITVGTFHSYFGSSLFYHVFHKPLQKYLERLDGRIAVSPACIEALSRYFKIDFKIIPNGVDTSWFGQSCKPVPAYADGAPNILFLGRLDPRNGLDILIDAMPKIVAQIPNARLLIAGDGPLRSYYEKQTGGLLNRHVFFEGQINESRPNYFAACDVFCYPATKASFGITLLEAMAAGRPVVAADNIGFKDVVQSGVNGYLARQGDPDDLARALIKVLQDRSFAAGLVAKGREMVKRYSWPRVTDEILAYYNEIFLARKGERFI